ncbi:MAG: hypothetical protein ABWK01_00585 [Infirmifilum sp.]
MEFIRKLHDFIHFRIHTPFGRTLLPGVARRYIATNLYDGTLLALGTVVSSLLLKLPPRETAFNGVVIGFSSLVSGFMGAFLVERAELTREISELEKHLFIRIGKRHVYMTGIILSLLNAASTSTPIFLSMTPYVLAYFGFLPVELAPPVALIITLLLLSLLGFFLGHIANENPARTSALTILSGLVILLFEMLLEGR